MNYSKNDREVGIFSCTGALSALFFPYPPSLALPRCVCTYQVDRGAVVCLQEVSILWAGEFHVFFMARGYAFVTANYGNPHNGYMGK